MAHTFRKRDYVVKCQKTIRAFYEKSNNKQYAGRRARKNYAPQNLLTPQKFALSLLRHDARYPPCREEIDANGMKSCQIPAFRYPKMKNRTLNTNDRFAYGVWKKSFAKGSYISSPWIPYFGWRCRHRHQTRL
ncbi:MAG: hypothetical protein LBU11_06000 [Zoogloeaceae bacterium]|jgi:hypothetical protein|nr:hypothetical protein [Zoogloeaceae bacterium]